MICDKNTVGILYEKYQTEVKKIPAHNEDEIIRKLIDPAADLLLKKYKYPKARKLNYDSDSTQVFVFYYDINGSGLIAFISEEELINKQTNCCVVNQD